MDRLIADIGGTNARFALVGADGRPHDEQRLLVADFPGPVEAARAYLGERKVRDAVFAVATPVHSDRVALTNSPWVFSVRATREALGLDRFVAINDFTAQALAVPRLAPDERVQIGGGEPRGDSIAVIGPGTGLGVAGLIRVRGDWHPIPSEGGHVSFAPHDERDAAVLVQLQRRFGHVSNERGVLSGPGLVNLATALAALDGTEFDVTDPQEIVRRASAGECRICREALERFSSLLGAAAGDLALVFCATAGVYIGGGLTKRLGEGFDTARFRAAFVAKGRFEQYLSAIPIYLVIRRDPGLLGAASYPLPE
jgi:glucokinase